MSRTDFEAAYIERYGHRPRGWNDDFQVYQDAHANGAWFGWQARAAGIEAKAAPAGEREAFLLWLGIKPCGAAHDLAWAAWKAGAAHQRQQAREVVSDAARDVLAERQRQISAEGMTNAGDDGYRAAELPRAAAAYILNGANDEAPAIWPWAKAWWKPRDARANYVRAGALILAEIERLDRLNKQEAGSHE